MYRCVHILVIKESAVLHKCHSMISGVLPLNKGIVCPNEKKLGGAKYDWIWNVVWGYEACILPIRRQKTGLKRRLHIHSVGDHTVFKPETATTKLEKEGILWGHMRTKQTIGPLLKWHYAQLRINGM